MIKVDSCSLIYSVKLKLFDKIKELYKEIIISPTVKKKVVDQGKLKGHTDAIIVEQYIIQNKIKIYSPKSLIENLNLGSGEVEILSLALEENCPCLIDDIKAQKIGIKLTTDLKSTPILLLELLKNNHLTVEIYEKYIEDYGKIANLSQNEIWLYKKIGDLIK